MNNFYIGSLQILGGANGYYLDAPIKGLESPPLRISQYDKPGESGGRISTIFYAPRVVTITGTIIGSDETTYETLRQNLALACAAHSTTGGLPTLTTFTFQTMANNTYTFTGQARLVMDKDYMRTCKFNITIQCPDPAVYGSSQTVSSLITRAAGGGFIVPVIVPITSSSATGGTAGIVNSGNLITYPILILTGPLTNPYIYNATTGEFIQLTYTIASGDIVRIDMANKLITLNGSSNLISAKTTDSVWWGLNPGSNTINFSTGSSSDTGSLQLTYYNAYLGV